MLEDPFPQKAPPPDGSAHGAPVLFSQLCALPVFKPNWNASFSFARILWKFIQKATGRRLVAFIHSLSI